jgi:hypothetical protein
MTFGYNATAVFDDSTANIVDHARDLLGCLVERRAGFNVSYLPLISLGNRVRLIHRRANFWQEVKRPLIFIGHSLGGLVTKQVPNSAFPILFNHTTNTVQGAHSSGERAAFQRYLQ